MPNETDTASYKMKKIRVSFHSFGDNFRGAFCYFLLFTSQKHFPEAITFIHEARRGAKGTYGGKTSNSGSSSSAGGVLVHW